jgi:hypothetical protein
MTAVANAAFTAAQFNAYVRDNLNETAPAKATAAGRLFVSTGLNAIVERVPTAATVATSDTTTSTSYTDLGATTGPTVSVVTGVSAFVVMTADMQNSVAGSEAMAALDISGATTVAATDGRALRFESSAAGDRIQASNASLVEGLTAGTNVFKMVYKAVTSGTATFQHRRLFVIPL